MNPITSFPEVAVFLILFILLQVLFESFELYAQNQNILLSPMFSNCLKASYSM